LAARDGVDFVNWQEGQHIEADFSLQGDWVDASIIEVNVDEDVVVIDFGDPLDQCWANDEISNVKAFSLLQVAAGGRLHRHFRPRYAGSPADILAALQVSAPGEAGTKDSDDDGSDECASPNEESKDEELPKVRCEACKEEPEQGRLDPCGGDTCNLLVCEGCRQEQGCKTCVALAEVVQDLQEAWDN
jgi:hypothetical protein